MYGCLGWFQPHLPEVLSSSPWGATVFLSASPVPLVRFGGPGLLSSLYNKGLSRGSRGPLPSTSSQSPPSSVMPWPQGHLLGLGLVPQLAGELLPVPQVPHRAGLWGWSEKGPMDKVELLLGLIILWSSSSHLGRKGPHCLGRKGPGSLPGDLDMYWVSPSVTNSARNEHIVHFLSLSPYHYPELLLLSL